MDSGKLGKVRNFESNIPKFSNKGLKRGLRSLKSPPLGAGFALLCAVLGPLETMPQAFMTIPRSQGGGRLKIEIPKGQAAISEPEPSFR